MIVYHMFGGNDMKNVMLDSLERMYKYGNFYFNATFGIKIFSMINGELVGRWMDETCTSLINIDKDILTSLAKCVVNSIDHSNGFDYKLESKELMLSKDERRKAANALYSLYSSMLNINNEKPYVISKESIMKKSVMLDILIKNAEDNNYGKDKLFDLDYTTMVTSLTDKVIRFVEMYKDLCQTRKDFDPSLGNINEWKPFEFEVISTDKNDDSNVRLNTRKLDSLNCTYEILNDREFNNNPAFGRSDEIRELGSILITKDYSPILVGNPGVGKTSIVEGLAYAINNKTVSSKLLDKKIIKISATAIVSGCRYVGMVEERVEAIIKFFRENPNAILYIDEIHTLIGAGVGGKENNDVANMLKPYIENGSVKMIGATTTFEYDSIMQNDPAFIRRFKKVVVKEPDDILLKQIINTVVDKFEIIYGIKFALNNQLRDVMIDSLIRFTKDKHRIYDDIRYNPALIISILEPAFGYAVYDDAANVGIKYLVEAILKCSYLYDKVKERLVEELKNCDEEEVKLVKKAIPLYL